MNSMNYPDYMKKEAKNENVIGHLNSYFVPDQIEFECSQKNDCASDEKIQYMAVGDDNVIDLYLKKVAFLLDKNLPNYSIATRSYFYKRMDKSSIARMPSIKFDLILEQHNISTFRTNNFIITRNVDERTQQEYHSDDYERSDRDLRSYSRSPNRHNKPYYNRDSQMQKSNNFSETNKPAPKTVADDVKSTIKVEPKI